MLVVSNKKFQQTTSETIMNGTFYWKGNPNGIMIYNGTTLYHYSSHYWQGFPQSVLYYDGNKLNIKRIKLAGDLGDVSKIKWAIGGVGLITPYGYSPEAEGFSGAYADVLRKCNKTVLATKGNKAYMVVAKSIDHTDLVGELRKHGFELAISLDGGGSTFLKCNNEVIIPTDGRTLNNWIVAL